MPAKLIDGKAIAEELRARIGAGVADLQAKHNLTPGLAVVLVGEDPASQVYVRNKGVATKAAGMASFEYRLNKDVSEADLNAKDPCAASDQSTNYYRSYFSKQRCGWVEPRQCRSPRLGIGCPNTLYAAR